MVALPTPSHTAHAHLKNSFVKQMSLAHMVHLFFWWLCSLQKKDSGSRAHGSPGSSYVLQARRAGMAWHIGRQP